MKLELADVEIFPLEVLKILPACDDFDAGVYFLWLDEKLQYVGKSRQICNRLVMHDHANASGDCWSVKPKQIPFDYHTCIIVESGRVYKDLSALGGKLQRLERAYIAHYKPPFNYLHANVGT